MAMTAMTAMMAKAGHQIPMRPQFAEHRHALQQPRANQEQVSGWASQRVQAPNLRYLKTELRHMAI